MLNSYPGETFHDYIIPLNKNWTHDEDDLMMMDVHLRCNKFTVNPQVNPKNVIY